MLCTCNNQFKSDENRGSLTPQLRVRNVSRQLSEKLRDGELKLLQGSIREAEVSLREALSINNEVHLVLCIRQGWSLIFQR